MYNKNSCPAPVNSKLRFHLGLGATRERLGAIWRLLLAGFSRVQGRRGVVTPFPPTGDGVAMSDSASLAPWNFGRSLSQLAELQPLLERLEALRLPETHQAAPPEFDRSTSISERPSPQACPRMECYHCGGSHHALEQV